MTKTILWRSQEKMITIQNFWCFLISVDINNIKEYLSSLLKNYCFRIKLSTIADFMFCYSFAESMVKTFKWRLKHIHCPWSWGDTLFAIFIIAHPMNCEERNRYLPAFANINGDSKWIIRRHKLDKAPYYPNYQQQSTCPYPGAYQVVV